MSEKQIGLIGLGLLGSAIAERLLGAGFDVRGYDTKREQREAFQRQGGKLVDSASSVLSSSRRIILSLPNSDIVAAVVEENRGSLQPGSIVMDTTTGDPDVLASLGPLLEKQDVGYLDSTVGGSSEQVRAHDVIVMVGGRTEHTTACKEIFDTFARRTFHVGPWGAGAKMKLVNNLVLGLNRAALAEALGFAESLGVAPAVALEILKSSSSYSRVMDIKGRKMLIASYEPEARLSQHLKDVRLILANGERHHARLPLSEVHRELLEELEAGGFGASDNSAIREAFRPTSREQPRLDKKSGE